MGVKNKPLRNLDLRKEIEKHERDEKED